MTSPARRTALGALAAVGAVAAHDLVQKKHAVLRNVPVVGHARYLLERLGPELRQCVVAFDDEERPFSRDQRRFVHASAKGENASVGFGTDDDVERYRRLPRGAPPHLPVQPTGVMPHAVGVCHPALITTDDVDVLEGDRRRTGPGEPYGYAPGGGRLDDLAAELRAVVSAGVGAGVEVSGPAG